MTLEIPDDILGRVRDRHALLWLAQGAELDPDAQAHGDDLPPADAIQRYQAHPGEDVHALARLYWEACWTESIVDLFFTAAEEWTASRTPDERTGAGRRPYRLASDPDQEGQIDRRAFLPIYEINGTSRTDEVEGRYGASPIRRQAYRLNLMRRLEGFSGHALFVVGARNLRELKQFSAAAEFVPSGTVVIVLWPTTHERLRVEDISARLDIRVVQGSVADLIDSLESEAAPAEVVPRYEIRLGTRRVTVEESDLYRVDTEFSPIFTRDFVGAADPRPAQRASARHARRERARRGSGSAGERRRAGGPCRGRQQDVHRPGRRSLWSPCTSAWPVWRGREAEDRLAQRTAHSADGGRGDMYGSA